MDAIIMHSTIFKFSVKRPPPPSLIVSLGKSIFNLIFFSAWSEDSLFWAPIIIIFLGILAP